MATCEFDVVEFDVGSGFSRNKIVVWSPYMVRMSNIMQDGQKHEVVRHMPGSSQCGWCCSWG
jgi:hypothetical protein